MIRQCNGVDPNLTRTIRASTFDPLRMIVSPWNDCAEPGTVVINCSCGRRFDDADRRVTWPHVPIAGTGG